jgi:hypothetical protein
MAALCPPTTLFQSLYHSSSHIINNTANSRFRIAQSGARITAVAALRFKNYLGPILKNLLKINDDISAFSWPKI